MPALRMPNAAMVIRHLIPNRCPTSGAGAKKARTDIATGKTIASHPSMPQDYHVVRSRTEAVLVDYARAHHCAKRGGAFRRVDFKESLMVSSEAGPELLQVDDALKELAEFDSRKAQVVEMRYFGGLTTNEIASILDISPQSVNRDWSLAKGTTPKWLVRSPGSNTMEPPRLLHVALNEFR